jgi:hypothetical protein
MMKGSIYSISKSLMMSQKPMRMAGQVEFEPRYKTENG